MRINKLSISIAFLVFLFSKPTWAWDPELGNTPAPLDRIEYLNGSDVDLHALRGNPVVIYFGADWCGPCRQRGRPAVIAASEKYKSKGVQVVFVDMDDNKIRDQKIQESKDIGVPIAMAKLAICPPGKCPDGLRDQGSFGRIYRYPTAIILDSLGVVRSRLSGGREVASGLDESIANALIVR